MERYALVNLKDKLVKEHLPVYLSPQGNYLNKKHAVMCFFQSLISYTTFKLAVANQLHVFTQIQRMHKMHRLVALLNYYLNSNCKFTKFLSTYTQKNINW